VWIAHRDDHGTMAYTLLVHDDTSEIVTLENQKLYPIGNGEALSVRDDTLWGGGGAVRHELSVVQMADGTVSRSLGDVTFESGDCDVSAGYLVCAGADTLRVWQVSDGSA
jgi:hypothetical protein